MRIGVNTRLLLAGKLEGLGRYAHEVLSRLVQIYPQHEFYFFFDRKYDPQFIYAPNVTPVVVYPSARHPVLYYIWFEWALPYYLKKLNIDLFFSPEGYLCLNSQVSQIHVVHDLAFEHYPQDISYLEGLFYRFFYPKYLQKAQKTVAISEFTRQDILNYYSADPQKIIPIWNGVSENFHPIDEAEQLKTRQKYTAGYPYFLYVGSIHPRKNLSNLIRAFNIFKKNTLTPHKLVIVGRKAWDYQKVLMDSNECSYRDDILFTGYIADEDLVKLYASCEAVCYVSYFEGFGLPAVEGFRSGVPVIASNTTSLPEVCGDAAILVDPHSPQDIANGMAQLIQNPEYRKNLIERGNDRVKLFSWQNTAESIGKLIFGS
ncbi:MAG: glycosyltransferase family 4 protein [Bacteroidia bacterium]|nr:glycosyltransferase family 4 protein [Bacteroidia bacterium]